MISSTQSKVVLLSLILLACMSFAAAQTEYQELSISAGSDSGLLYTGVSIDTSVSYIEVEHSYAEGTETLNLTESQEDNGMYIYNWNRENPLDGNHTFTIDTVEGQQVEGYQAYEYIGDGGDSSGEESYGYEVMDFSAGYGTESYDGLEFLVSFNTSVESLKVSYSLDGSHVQNLTLSEFESGSESTQYYYRVADPSEGTHSFELESVNGQDAPVYEDSASVSSENGSNSSDSNGSAINVTSFNATGGDSSITFRFSANDTLNKAGVVIELEGAEQDSDILYVDQIESLSGDKYRGTLSQLGPEIAVSSLPDGEYNAKLVSANGNYFDEEDVRTSRFFIGAAKPSIVDDRYKNTSTDYHYESAFIGHELNLTKDSGVFTLIDDSANVEGSVDASNNEKFSTQGLSEGRYILNGSSGNITRIDVLDPSADVVSRIANFTDPAVDVYRYQSGEEIQTGTSDEVNISTISSWQGDEHIFRMNTTLKDYWVEINDQGSNGTKVEASRFAQRPEFKREKESCEEETEDDGSGGGTATADHENDTDSCGEQLSKPFVQDFSLDDSYKVNGTVQLDSENVSGVEVVLKGYKPGYTMKNRNPFYEAPPRMETVTDQSGEFTFYGVPPGSYSVALVNDSWVRTDVDRKGSSEFDNTLGDPIYEKDFDLASNSTIKVHAENETGTLNLTIDGPMDGFFYGYELVQYNSEEYWSYSEMGVADGKNVTIPVGTYDLSVRRNPVDGYDGTYRNLGEINISNDGVTDESVKFSKTVYLNGSIKGGSIDEGYISMRSQENFNSYFTRIEPDEGHWDYSKQVAANTTYDVKFYPPWDSSFVEQTVESFQINGSGATLNFSLESGTHFSGTVKAGDEPVDAYVSVSNYSKDAYGDGRAEDGTFNLTGLESGRYEVSVYPESPKYDTVRETLTIPEEGLGGETFDVSQTLIEVNGTVTVTGDETIEGSEISLRSSNRQVEDRELELNSSGEYSFHVPRNVFYRITVEPESDSLKRTTKSRYLTENETIDFTLTTPTELTGIVNTTEGERVENAYIYAYNWSKGSYDSDTTDENGSYNLELESTAHKVEIWPEPGTNLAPMTTNVSQSEVSDGKNFTFDVSSFTYISGKVQNANGDGMNGSISIWNETKRSYDYQRLNRTDGSFNLTGLQDVGHNVWISTRNSSIPVEETTISKPSETGNNKTFTLGNNSQTATLVITVHEGSSTGPAEPNVTVSTPNREKTTNSSGMVDFQVATPFTESIYMNKEGFNSRIEEISISGGTDSRNLDFGLNRTQEYKVRLNVSEYGSNDSDISPPATVVFVSRENQSSKGGSATVNNEGDRPFIEHLTTGDYLVGVATGPDTVYENTTAEIPEDGTTEHTDALNLTDSSGEVQFSVWYEVRSQ